MAFTNIKITIVLLLLIGVLKVIVSLRVIPERTEVNYINPKYVKYGKFYIRRYNRGGLYYSNAEGRIYHTWGNNVSLHLVFNEYLDNEYRRTFVEVHIRFCDLVNKDPYLGHLFRIYNIPCPAPPNEYRIMNLTIPEKLFPNVWPFEKARLDIEFAITDTKEPIANAYYYATFVNDINFKKNNEKKRKNKDKS